MDCYFDDQGTRFLTSEFLRKRGHCCKSSCLHCPYGHTLKTIKFQFEDYTNQKKQLLETLRENGYNLEQNFVNDLLSEALNEKTKEVDLEVLIHEGVKLIYLKGYYCGFYVPTTENLFLKLHFKYQGITEEIIKEQLNNTL